MSTPGSATAATSASARCVPQPTRRAAMACHTGAENTDEQPDPPRDQARSER